jgi:hypothetical protein
MTHKWLVSVVCLELPNDRKEGAKPSIEGPHAEHPALITRLLLAAVRRREYRPAALRLRGDGLKLPVNCHAKGHTVP